MDKYRNNLDSLRCLFLVFVVFERKIQENATLVSEEHAIQERVEKAKKTEEALDNFMSELESVLDLRESMIVELNESVSEYRKVTAQLQVVT